MGLTGLTANSFATSFLYYHFYPWDTVEGRNGKYYGSLLEGGTYIGGCVYSLSREGKFKITHEFPRTYYSSNVSRSGFNPEGKLSIGQDGSIYGATREGGVFGNGLLFKIDNKGRYSKLFSLDQFGYYKAAVLAAQNGDVFVVGDNGVCRLSKNGSRTNFATTGYLRALVETANHEIVLATYSGGFNNSTGTLWRLNSSDQFEVLAEVGYIPNKLIPLPDGSVACCKEDRILQVSENGTISDIHVFGAPFEGRYPNFLTVAKDGSFIGSTTAGGLEGCGTVFRIVPESNTFTILSHLHAPGRRGAGFPWMEDVFPLRVDAESGNLPPMAKDDVVEAKKLKSVQGSLPQVVIPILANDSDADADPLTIVSVGTAEHGTVAFDFVTQQVTYTASAPEVQNDSFTYTITDGNGGSSVGHVIVRANCAGRYSGTVSSPPNSSTGDPGTVVGNISVTLTGRRDGFVRLELLEKTYRIRCRFNEVNRFGTVLSVNPHLGRSASLQLWLRPNGAAWTVEATVQKNGLQYSAECLPIQN